MARFFHTGAVWPVEARAHFGSTAPVVFGWVSAAHQVGAGSVAYVGGAVRDVFGTYDMAWVGAGVLCAVAALGALVIGRGEPGAGSRGRVALPVIRGKPLPPTLTNPYPPPPREPPTPTRPTLPITADRAGRPARVTGWDDMADWTLRAATAADVEPIAELRAVVMRPDLERLGRYDEQRVRQRFRDAYEPAHAWVIEVAGAFAGCVALRPDGTTYWLEHFFLAPELHGRGVGGAVLRELLERCDRERAPVRLNVLRGSPARRLYERHGFAVESEDPVDVFMARRPATTTPERAPATERHPAP